MIDETTDYQEASQQAVELGNRLADDAHDADVWDIADGLLAGAIQYWLYSRQPCGDPGCEDCSTVCTATLRMQALTQLVDELAQGSEYFHSPTDFDAGRA